MEELAVNDLFATNYLLLERLPAGGFAEVWKARYQKGGTIIALKIYNRLDEDGIELFREEYARVFDLHHSNLLKASHFDTYNNRPFLIFPFCTGGSTYGYKGDFSFEKIIKLMRQITSALEYMHKRNIIHQDIKPHNIMVTGDEDFLLADFGISSRLRHTLRKSVLKSETEDLKGGLTLEYAAPERFSKNKDYQRPILANDIFSLGVTVFELATGELPFGDDIPTGVAISTGAEFPDLPEPFPESLKKLISRCVAKDTWDRPTCSEILRILSDIEKEGNPISAGIKCIHCGKELKSISSFCSYCGKTQAEEPKTEKCIHCGKPVKSDAKYCNNCGKSQDKEKTTCINCEMEIQKTSIHCVFCGANQLTRKKKCKNPKCTKELAIGLLFCNTCGTRQK